MAISILQQPGEISFCRNPVNWVFSSNRKIIYAGLPSIAKLYFLQPGVLSYSFKLSWGGQEREIFVGVGVGDDGYFIPTGFGRAPAAIVQDAVKAFQSNFYIDRDFTITYGADANGPFALFTSKKNDPAYNMSAPESAFISLQPQQGAIATIENKNFKLFMRLWVEEVNRSGFYQAFETYLETDDDGKSMVDVSGALADELRREYDRPNLNLPVAMQCLNSVRRYYLQVAEVYGDKQLIRRMETTEIKTAALGGFSKEKLEESLFPNDFQMGSQSRFLNQYGLEKVVRPEQPEFLTWMALSSGYAGIYLEIKLFWANGTSQTQQHYAFANVPKYGKYCWPVGMMQNNYHLIKEDIGILRYECTVKSSLGSVLSETKTFYVEYQYRRYTRYFVYLSSLGSYDTQVTYGKGSNEYELVKEMAEIVQKGDYRLIDGDSIEFESSLTHTETVTTGYRQTRQEIRAFRDLFLSSDRFIARKGRFYPISLASKTIKEFQDGEYQYALSFDIGSRYSEKLWSYDEKDDQPGYLLFPIIVAGGGAGGTNLPENYFDYRYYRKTETYNRSEIDQKFATIQAQVTANLNLFNQKIADLQLQINNRALINHNHDDRYQLAGDAALPFVVNFGSGLYTYSAPNTVITDERLIDLEGYPVNNNTTNVFFRGEDLIYDPVNGKLTIKNFQLLAGDQIRIG